MAQDLITLEEYKTFNGITKTDQDFKITLLISTASNLIKNYVGNSIIDNWTIPVVETLTIGYETAIIFPKQYPIREIISIEEIPYIQGTYLNDSSIHVPLTLTNDYVMFNGALTRVNNVWNPNFESVIITYTAGYETTPNDIKMATILLVEYYLKEHYVQNRTIMGTSMQNYSTSGTDLPAHIARILDFYTDRL